MTIYPATRRTTSGSRILCVILAAAITALLAGCGGGGSTAATSPATTAVSRGAIASVGAGNIIVAGVTIDTTQATVTMADNTDAPVLKPGMVVTVKGTFDDNTHARANSVEFADTLKGPVSNIDRAANTLTILGQAVRFDPARTVFDDFPGPGTSGIALGQMVQVSGFADNAGVITATRIERHLPDWTPASIVELKGTVGSVVDNTFTIGNLTVDFTGITLPAGIVAGSFVKIEGRIPSLASTMIRATRVEMFAEEPPEAEGKHVEIEGIVSGLAGNRFLVGTTPVNAGTLSLAGVANGARVEVEGTLVAGILVATQISLEGAAPPPTTAPAAPTGAMATGGFRQVTVAWNAVAGATSYNLYWSTTTGVTPTTGTKITNVTSPYTQMGLADSTTYFYVVTAVNAVGESLASAQTSAMTTSALMIPPAPIGVSAVGGARQVTISWAPVTGAVSYRIFWATIPGVTPATGTQIPNITASTYVQLGLADNTTYFYVVTAVNAAGQSIPSAQVSATTSPAPATAPTAPVGVVAAGGTRQVTVSWAPVANATTYRIYWSTTTGVLTTTGTLIDNVTSSYTQTGLLDGTTYFYIVTAVNAVGESPASGQVSATTAPAAPTVPPAPGGLNAVGGTNMTNVSWTAVTGATSYNLYWATTTGVTPTTGTAILGVTSPYRHINLAAATGYFYVVTAVNGVGESLPSAQASATTSALDGLALYGNCSATSCHGAFATSGLRSPPRTAAQIQSAINGNVGGMGFLSTLTAAQLQAIADVLTF